ncbi:MAG TPA: polysulfide reductase, NrfD [Mariprofundaceae bacterium]|nr:polysulfide reductase, NrfD [Mariprofundaceae bacterium]
MHSYANWAILMDNFLFVLYIPLAAVFWCAVLHLVNGKWRFEVRGVLASATALFPLGFVLLLIILAAGQRCFPWMGGDNVGGEPLNGWHNITFFNVREIVLYLAVWGFCSYFVRLQKTEFPNAPEAMRRRFRNVALLVPFVYCIYGTIIAWDFEMTQIPRWWSPIYGPYHFESMMRMFLAFSIIALFILRKRDVLKVPMHDYVFNYIAQIMLALTIIWTYAFFVQYLVMWYGKLPDEMMRYFKMMDGPNWFLFWAFFFMNSFIPFLMLIFKAMRNSPALMLIPSASIVMGTFLERYMWIISPHADDIDHTPFLSSWVDVAITVSVLIAAYLLWSRRMRKDGLLYEEGLAEETASA